MGRSEQRAKSAKQAAELIKRGFPHGRRQQRPYPDSGGLTMSKSPGSTKYKRRLARMKK